MVVLVRLNALLRKYAPLQGNTEFTLQLPEGCTIEDLIRRLGVPPAQVGFATLNLKYVRFSQILQEDDQVILFPPLTGG